MPWKMNWLPEAKRGLKNYGKKWSHEVNNVGDNLETLLGSLNEGVKAEQLKSLGFVHSEPNEILAIDQSGPAREQK